MLDYLRQCPECGELFDTDDKNQLHCSACFAKAATERMYRANSVYTEWLRVEGLGEIKLDGMNTREAILLLFQRAGKEPPADLFGDSPETG